MADRWTLDYGEGSTVEKFDTLQKAINKGSKTLSEWKARAEKYANDTVPDIRQGIETLGMTPFEGRTLRVCVDRHTDTYVTIRIRREEIPAEEQAQVEAAKAAKRKDKAPK